MPRDLRARLWDEIRTEQNNVLTATEAMEQQAATKKLALGRIERAKRMLAALDGERNQYSVMLFEQPNPVVQESRPWWKFWAPRVKEGDQCVIPESTSIPPLPSAATPIASRRAAKSAR